MLVAAFPEFVPHPLVRGGHAQTLVAAYLPARNAADRARLHRVALDDGDQLVLHDDCPGGWQANDRTALLMHGLAGSHQSGYMQRIAGKLCARGVRVFRMDLRGCGAGFGLARLPYHSGRSEDAAAALRHIARECPASATTLVGFSLSGNITLKLLGELGDEPCGNLVDAMAICPPIDLAACSRRIGEGANRLYDWRFVSLLLKQLKQGREIREDMREFVLARRPRRLFEFDDLYTAPVSGFGDAENYYRVASSAQFVPRIRRPTLILTSQDDPLIPFVAFERLDAPPSISLLITQRGGHLGYLARRGADPDLRWMDWRVVDWVTRERA